LREKVLSISTRKVAMKVQLTARRVFVALGVTIILSNILFWLLVGFQFSPVKDQYDDGRIVRIGRIALVFGHGEWIKKDSVEEHFTTAYLREGLEIKRPTLEVVEQLRREGSLWIWGTWCYSGDHNFIRRNVYTGNEVEWPSYVSRNENPGETLPLWLGVGFVRLSVGSRHKEASPEHKELKIEDWGQFANSVLASPNYFGRPLIY
jgi:hypothetical protein